jgi:LPXTG-site transpeptidase (sortase) family protein
MFDVLDHSSVLEERLDGDLDMAPPAEPSLIDEIKHEPIMPADASDFGENYSEIKLEAVQETAPPPLIQPPVTPMAPSTTEQPPAKTETVAVKSETAKKDLLDLRGKEEHVMPNFLANDALVGAPVQTAEQPVPKPAKTSKRQLRKERKRIEKAEKLRAAEESIAEMLKEESESPKRLGGLRFAIAGVMVVAMAFLAYDTVKTNLEMKAYMEKPREAAVYDAIAKVNEEPISNQERLNHKVARTKPRYIKIDSINVDARIIGAGKDEYGRIDVPDNIFDVNWLSESARAGEAGAMVLNGHISGPTQAGAFTKIAKLKTGDRITIERGDGLKVNYEVAKIETVRLSDIKIDDILLPFGDAAKGLNLIVNSGQWAQADQANSDRTIVYAVTKQ